MAMGGRRGLADDDGRSWQGDAEEAGAASPGKHQRQGGGGAVQELKAGLKKVGSKLIEPPIIPPDNGRVVPRQYGAQPGPPPARHWCSSLYEHLQPVSDGVVSRRQAKLEAAASANSIYGRSFAYPPANTLNRYLEYLHLM